MGIGGGGDEQCLPWRMYSIRGHKGLKGDIRGGLIEVVRVRA